MTSIVETHDVTKQFGDVTVIDGVSLNVPQGAIYGLVGANGAGKTTLMRMLIGLMWPDAGEVRLFGQVLERDSAQIRQRVHYVAADGSFFKQLQVKDVLTYSRLLYERWDDTRCQMLVRALVPLNRRVRNLSLGMTMQLRLAIALSARPDLLVLDEPTNGLDPIVKRQFLQLIVQEAAQGSTVVIATHQLADVERIVDGVGLLYRGRMVMDGMLDDLKGAIKHVQAVLPGGPPADIDHWPGVLERTSRGQFYTFVVEGTGDDLAKRLRESGATYLEVMDVGFEELFRYVMQKEGYSRDGILLS
ncbi:ABC transporter ATP-binding protein [Alicyclobacillus acidoterrestris]|uniref:ABC transporter ATP-binding protein n=1 Tax=Alicyclobacillus acidoterrestris TaxID=1450 RepID=UPI003F5330BD